MIGPDLNPRKTLRIARWEVGKAAGTADRRVVGVAVLALVVAALAGPSLAAGVTLEQDIYRVGVAEDSPYRPVVEQNPQFVAREPSGENLRSGRIEVLVADGRVQARETAKGLAAYEAFRSAVQSYNDDRAGDAVLAGADQSAAFPVDVALFYEGRTLRRDIAGGTGDGTGDGGGGGGTGDGGGGVGGGDSGGGGGPLQVPALSGTGGSTRGPPGSISPPFPFGSLVLAFAFIIPMNFVVQSYGSTIMDERINRRGELLLVSPASPTDIVAGKTLPYFGLLVAISAAIAALVGGGPLSVAAVVPLAVLFLSATFVGAMFARSFKELTFVTVTISVFLTAYAFVPAIFTEITPIALISPLTVVVRDLQGTAVAPLEFAFSTGPVLFAGVVLFVLGKGVYREEDMFTQRPVHLKAVDALAARIGRPRDVLLWSALFIPFVFVAELLAVALLFALPVEVSLIALLGAIAVVEELAKSAHVYAGFEHARYDRSARTALLVGVLSGLGFFVGEKAFVVVQTVGLPSLPQGRPLFPAGAGGIDPALAAGLLAAPLLLHTVTAAVSALGARRDATGYAVAVTAAAAVHVAYNLAILEVVGSGL